MKKEKKYFRMNSQVCIFFCDCLNKFGFYYLNLNLPYLFIFLVLSESSRCFFLDLTPILKAFYSLLKTKNKQTSYYSVSITVSFHVIIFFVLTFHLQ